MKELCMEAINSECLSFLCLQKLNQDHVENLHAQIRNYHGNNIHPMLDAYINAIRCLSSAFSTSELLDSTLSSGANCQPDKDCMVHEDDAPGGKPVDPSQPDHSIPSPPRTAQWCWALQSHKLLGTSVALWTKKVKKSVTCQLCNGLLLSSDVAAHHLLTILKEYKQNALQRTSHAMTMLCADFESYFQMVTIPRIPLVKPRATIIAGFK